MMNSKSTLELSVWLNEELVGNIIRLTNDRHWFIFNPSYLNNENRQTLSLSFKSREGDTLVTPKPVQTRVPSFFSNLLPEGHLRDYIAQHLAIKSDREFFLLAALGTDLPGAIKILPVDFDPLHPDFQKTHSAYLKKMEDPVLRFSLAGVQLKFSAVAEAHGGLTIPIDGIGGSWIVKLPSLRFPHIPENEFTMLTLARSIGIPVPALRLVPVKEIQGLPKEAASLEGNALVIARFDRDISGKRIHMEDFAQVFGLFPERKYERRNYANIAQVLSAEAKEKDVTDFIRRLIFSTLIGNGDMHLKNWSLLYPDGITPELSPAYDFVSTIPYLQHDHLALNFGDSKDIDRLTHQQIRRFADAANLPSHSLLTLTEETIALTLDAWKNLAEKSLLSTTLQRLIEKHLTQVALSFNENILAMIKTTV